MQYCSKSAWQETAGDNWSSGRGAAHVRSLKHLVTRWGMGCCAARVAEGVGVGVYRERLARWQSVIAHYFKPSFNGVFIRLDDMVGLIAEFCTEMGEGLVSSFLGVSGFDP